MKLSSLLSSVVLASLLVGCGADEGACCESNIDISKKKEVSNTKVPEVNVVVDTYLNDTKLQDNGSKDTPPVVETPSIDNTQPAASPSTEVPEKEFINLPPVAVIDVSHCGSSYTISCKDSYDGDKDGDSIKQCNWDIVSYDANGCPHKTYKKCDTNDTQDAFIAPCEHVKYIEVKLTVIDNEGSHDCVKEKIEVR